jgi:hypothetical protein
LCVKHHFDNEGRITWFFLGVDFRKPSLSTTKNPTYALSRGVNLFFPQLSSMLSLPIFWNANGSEDFEDFVKAITRLLEKETGKAPLV